MRRAASLALVFLLMTLGCGTGDEPATTPHPGAVLDPNDPSILMRPFTAEEIRDEWVPGLRLLMRRSSPDEIQVERWTVVAADDEGADIEFATIAEDGSVVGEPSVVRSAWVELRDHASFPAAHSTREWVSRSTMLGEFEGWLYRVAEPDATVINEFFFVPELPGAPVQVRALDGNATVFELEQTARLRPDTD